jgi:hypothetical protein
MFGLVVPTFSSLKRPAAHKVVRAFPPEIEVGSAKGSCFSKWKIDFLEPKQVSAIDADHKNEVRC